MGFLALFPSRFEMCSSNSAKKLSLDSSKWTAAETLLNVKKSYISEAASRKTSQNVMTYRKIPWQLDMDSYSLPNYQGISYFCYCLSMSLRMREPFMENFNTTLVTVYLNSVWKHRGE